MADVNKTIAINYEASTKKLETSLRKIPRVTDKEFAKASKAINKNMKKAEKAADRAAKKSAASFKKFGKSAGMVTGALAAVGAGAIALGQHFADLTNELADAQTKTGLSIENLSGLRLALEGSGKSFSDLEPGLIKFQQRIQQAAQGSKKAAEAFRILGVETEIDGKLRPANDVFEDMIKSLKKMEPGTQRNAVLLDLLGNSGAALAQSGAIEHMEEFNRLANDFGVSVGPQSVETAARFQRSMAALKSTGAGTFQSIIEAITGGGGGQGLNNLIEGLTEGMVYFGSIGSDSLAAISQGFEDILVLGEAAFLTLEGKSEQARALIRDTTKENTIAANNFINRFERADKKLAEYRATAAATMKTQKGLNKGVEEGAEEQDEQTKGIDKATAALKRQEAATKAIRAIQGKQNAKLMSEREQLIASYVKESVEIMKLAEQGASIRQVEAADRALTKAHNLEMSELDAANAQTVQEQSDQRHAKTIADMQEERDLRQSFAGSISDSFSQTSAAITQIAQNQGEITAEQALKLHRLNKASAITDITVNTAVAITRALRDLGPIFGPIAAGAITAAGATQITAVASAPPPTFDMGGQVGNNDPLRPDEQMIRALTGETVLSRAASRDQSKQREIVVVSPFRHWDRFNKSANKMTSSQTRRQKARY